MEAIDNFILFESDEEFEDFCVAPYATIKQSENGTTYTFSFYHDKYTYIIEMEGYKDTNKINEDLKFIICTMHPDYKQAQD